MFTFPDSALGYVDPVAIVEFPVPRYAAGSKETHVLALLTKSNTLNIVAMDKNNSPVDWLILNKEALPALIHALRLLDAGPLSRLALQAEWDKSHE